MNDTLAINTLRGLALDLPRAADSGHSGTALALAPLGWVLYSRILRYDPRKPQWEDRDRLVFSNGHACVLQYGLLHMCGFDLTLDDLKAFRKPHSRTPGHPESWMTAGVDTSTGPLGQGLAMAVGMAMAERFLQARFGPDLVDHRTYVICSDGDLLEGVSGEASSLAGHQKLGKLIVCYDDNDVTIDGPLSQSASEDIPTRYRAYGWQVLLVANGENLEHLERALREAENDPRPTLIVVKTVIGFPAPGMQGKPEAHSPAFSPEEIRATKTLMGMDPDATYQILAHHDSTPGLEAAWQERLRKSGLRDEWIAWHARQIPAGWEPPVFEGKVATRVASGRVLTSLAARMPNLLGGSADLAGSTNALLEGFQNCSSEHPDGRNIRFGVREHAMAAICNGLYQHGGVLPFASTYFAFSDYMKPALRLGALMRLSPIFVWTHDSLALGEDGPTHQPVEHLVALRALPHFTVIRPADANETAEAWQLAVHRQRGPVGLILSRQALPVLPAKGSLWRGAYVVEEAQGTPQLVLLATGSEVHICLEARITLQERGIATRVVSMPSWELFEEQPREYQREVLGENLLRISVEAGATLGWHRWVGDGETIGVDRFGASAPGPDLMREYGFTSEHVVSVALGRLTSENFAERTS